MGGGAPGIKVTNPPPSPVLFLSYGKSEMSSGPVLDEALLKMFCKESDLDFNSENEYKLANIFKDFKWVRHVENKSSEMWPTTSLHSWENRGQRGHWIPRREVSVLPLLWWNKGLCLFRKSFHACSSLPNLAMKSLSFKQNTNSWGNPRWHWAWCKCCPWLCPSHGILGWHPSLCNPRSRAR